jgi:hypothetical protein
MRQQHLPEEQIGPQAEEPCGAIEHQIADDEVVTGEGAEHEA